MISPSHFLRAYHMLRIRLDFDLGFSAAAGTACAPLLSCCRAALVLLGLVASSYTSVLLGMHVLIMVLAGEVTGHPHHLLDLLVTELTLQEILHRRCIG